VTAYVRPRGEGISPQEHFAFILSAARSEFARFERRGSDFILGNGEEIVVSQRFLPALEGGFVRVSMAFRGVQSTEGLAKVMDIATRESVTCEFSIAARGVEDFSAVRQVCQSSAPGFSYTPDGNFHASIRLRGVPLDVDAFPSTGNLAVKGTYNRFIGDIRGALRFLLTGRSPSLIDSFLGSLHI
jgi:hypothetical protein